MAPLTPGAAMRYQHAAADLDAEIARRLSAFGVGADWHRGQVSTWSAEFYEDADGRRPVEAWMGDLGEIEFEALATAIEEILEKDGIALASTPWLKALGEGLHEFRVRHDAATITALYADSGASKPAKPAKILLRLFVHFHGQKIILLLHGYDKGSDDSPRRQNKEIEEARKRLRAWRLAQASQSKKQSQEKPQKKSRRRR